MLIGLFCTYLSLIRFFYNQLLFFFLDKNCYLFDTIFFSPQNDGTFAQLDRLHRNLQCQSPLLFLRSLRSVTVKMVCIYRNYMFYSCLLGMQWLFLLLLLKSYIFHHELWWSFNMFYLTKSFAILKQMNWWKSLKRSQDDSDWFCIYVYSRAGSTLNAIDAIT